MRTIEYKGIEVTYDERVLKSWKWQKAVASGDNARMLGAMERLLCGRDEEYADALCGNEDSDDLDTSADAMQELVAAVIEDAQAKN